AKIIRQIVGFLTEFPGLYPRMSLGDYLDFFGELYGISKEERRRRIDELMERFGVLGMRGKHLAEFSKGMRQRVALVRALIHDPQILFLDEPTSAMDPHSAKMVRDYIRGLRSSRHTILLCTHNLAEAESLADRVAIISQGRIMALGTPGELKRQFLGTPLFELRLASPLDRLLPKVGEWVEIEEHGPTWFRYRTPSPEEVNPLLLHRLAEEGAEVVTLSEVPRSLEEVYLHIMEDGNGDTLSVQS
ncbi:MAG: ABC transporter ATP-binding protein, partial [Anaerolineae bacterium]|nr:ABC transporter ATP-binding protein [Anaerolineae bacterium]